MKYYEVEFSIAPYSEDAADLVAALAGEAGFDTFEETETGLKGYVQQQLFADDTLREALADFPIEGVSISYEVREAEDRDWNEQWEQEGFEPIAVADRLIIHDGRHPIPADYTGISIEIDARLAFGTGTHETTRMVCAALLDLNLAGKRVLDCGTGTGILSICALKFGAAAATGYDIDEWSADNARHNAIINCVDDRFTSLLGDASLLTNEITETFDVVVANINRNILLNDMPAFRARMASDATLILSGFYTADSPMLISKAESLGLHLKGQQQENDWACLIFGI